MEYSEQYVLQELAQMVYGSSQKAIAHRLRITPQYLCDVLKVRRQISEELASRLGYRRVVKFERKRK